MPAPDYITNDAVVTYVPVPFRSDFPRSTTPPSSGGGNGSGGDDGGDGTVYASALFIDAVCSASDVVGAWVRAADAQGSVVTTTSSLSYPAIGVIVSKLNSTSCVVQTYGLCTGVYGNLTPNLRMFVGPDGKAALGSALPSGTAYVQPIAFSVRSDTIFVQPSGTLYRRDASASPNDPAPAPSSDSTSTYRPVLHGVGAPASDVGQIDDVYLDTSALAFYGPKDVNGWGQPQPVATQGQQGIAGSRIYRVQTLPTDASPYAAGDLLIDDQGNMAQIVSS